jgi:hypothetical protein
MFVQDASGDIDAYLIDHEKAMMGHADEMGVDRLVTFTEQPTRNFLDNVSAWIHPGCDWSDAITEWADVLRMVERISAIPTDVIETIVGQIPAAWAGNECRDALLNFLLVRQTRLLEIITTQRDRFKNLKGAP